MSRHRISSGISCRVVEQLLAISVVRTVIAYALTHAREGSGMTPEDCRAIADICFQWVRDAQTAVKRKTYLNIARAWLEAAASAEEEEPRAMPLTLRLQAIRTMERMRVS